MKSYLPWETDPDNYEALFQRKCDAVEASFAPLALPTAERFASPPQSYRARAEFRVWHTDERLDFVMFDPQSPRTPVPISDFAPGITPIRELMPRLRNALQENPVLRKKLFQAEFMASKSGELLVTLIYHRRLDESWLQAAELLVADLGGSGTATRPLHIVGRSRGQKIVIGADFIRDSFCVGDDLYRYRQYEQAFVQPNAAVNEKMLTWAWDQAVTPVGNLLELYCGNGNFTLPLARRHVQVVATELSKSGARAARENLAENHIDNVEVVRLSAEEASQAMRGEREFRRLRDLPVPLSELNLRSVFVDPPRAGVDSATLACLRGFDRIYYVSCNPETLRDNLLELRDTHSVDALAFFDQFPYGPHLESAVVLKRL